METSASSTRRKHATLLTLWTGEGLILEYCTTAAGCGWLLKPCVEPGQNMESVMDCGQLESRMQRRAVNAVKVKEGVVR